MRCAAVGCGLHVCGLCMIRLDRLEFFDIFLLHIHGNFFSLLFRLLHGFELFAVCFAVCDTGQTEKKPNAKQSYSMWWLMCVCVCVCLRFDVIRYECVWSRKTSATATATKGIPIRFCCACGWRIFENKLIIIGRIKFSVLLFFFVRCYLHRANMQFSES